MTTSIDNGNLAQEVLKRYAEHDAVYGKGDTYLQRPKYQVVQDSEQRRDLGLNATQGDALNRVMEDGVVDGEERKALAAAGFEDKFIQAVAGVDGQAALKKRVLWLSNHGAAKFSNAMELRLAAAQVGGLTSDENESVNEGLGEVDEAIRDLIKVSRDREHPQERLEALQKLVAFSATELGRKDPALDAILEALDDSSLVLEKPQIIRLLGDLPASAAEPVLGKLVQALQDSSGLVKQEALAALNKVFLRAIDQEMRSGFGDILWAMQKVEAFAKDPRQDVLLRNMALIVLANSGRRSAVPGLTRMLEWGSSPEVQAWSKRTVEEEAGPRPEPNQFRDNAAYDCALQQWTAKRDEAQVRIETAQKLVGNAQEAKVALQRCQEQIDARTRVDRGGLQMYSRAEALPILAETSDWRQTLVLDLEASVL